MNRVCVVLVCLISIVSCTTSRTLAEKNNPIPDGFLVRELGERVVKITAQAPMEPDGTMVQAREMFGAKAEEICGAGYRRIEYAETFFTWSFTYPVGICVTSAVCDSSERTDQFQYPRAEGYVHCPDSPLSKDDAFRKVIRDQLSGN